ncbi:MAG: fibrobacter succinogenes major paralogous domain-containing protein [Paludibacteraceae bacterium]|nr:fibrobacter succinogenes major paralogous domain-containing protein [Paludibacteraceae bacterium]
MKKSLFLFTLTIILPIAIVAQSVTLKFTGVYSSNQYVQLNRVVIKNLTKGWQETIYWPDTTLVLQNGTGIEEMHEVNGIYLTQNVPNPFEGTTEATLVNEIGGETTLSIYDLNGHLIVKQEFHLPTGTHRFMIHLATANAYLLNASANGLKTSIKMVCDGGGVANKIDYIGGTAIARTKALSNNPFSYTDNMEYIGYATINGSEMESVHITQTQNTSQTITLHFNASSGGGTACPGTPTLTDYDGNVYNTVKIGSQCWMKENLRTTHYASGGSIDLGTDTSSTVAYRYYPAGSSSNVSVYGYLYNWSAVMHGSSSSSTNPSGVQGVCPNGWHMPSETEWTQLINYVSSQSQFWCDNNSENIAKALAANCGWLTDGTYPFPCAVGNNLANNNSTGFSILPSGTNGVLHLMGSYAYFWSASQDSYSNATSCIYIQTIFSTIMHYVSNPSAGYSVRCLKN